MVSLKITSELKVLMNTNIWSMANGFLTIVPLSRTTTQIMSSILIKQILKYSMLSTKIWPRQMPALQCLKWSMLFLICFKSIKLLFVALPEFNNRLMIRQMIEKLKSYVSLHKLYRTDENSSKQVKR